jgi:hypothetical protein
LFRDSAYAVRRSVHAYDVVPAADYAAVFKIPAVYAYGVVPQYDSAYASRRSVVHAYDVITQQDSADRSGQVAISASDVLIILALKILERYLTFDLAAASAVPTVHAEDFIIYDAGALLNTVKAASAYDYLVLDFAGYSKSYSPLFFTIFQRRVPITRRTLPVLDVVAVADSASHAKSCSPLLFLLTQRRLPIRYATLTAVDSVPVLDSASASAAEKIKSVADYIAYDYVRYMKINAVSVADYIAYDYVPHMSPSDIRYRSLYANVGMRTISVFDRVAAYESVWVGPRVATVHVKDYLVSDGASAARRSVHAYDILGYDNVNIVRIT